MINLLPDDIKHNNRYAVRNSRLLRYTFLSAGTALSIVLITTISILTMLRSQQQLQAELERQNVKLNSLKRVEADGQKLYDRITAIDQLLDRQITYSTLLPELASILPPGAILKQLEFSTADLTGQTSQPTPNPQPAPGGGTTPAPVAKAPEKPFLIQAAVTNPEVATRLLENLRASKEWFTSADLIDVSNAATESSGDEDSLSKRYPYQVTINAYLKKKNPGANSQSQEVQVIQPAAKKTEKTP